MELFDTHAHLDDEQLRPTLPAVVSRARAAGVRWMIAVGTTAASSRDCLEIAQHHDDLFAAVGIQPNYCAQAGAEDWAAIEQLACEPRVAAIGETGLDRHWDFTPWEVQEDFFRRHLQLAQDRELPVIIHMRDCGDDIVRELDAARRRGPLRGVMHSFTGDVDLMQRCVELGMHISFAGMVTFKKSVDLRRVATATPADRLLIETDSPYLSPHPERSRRPNEPALLVHTAQCLADVRGLALAELAELTTRNAAELFGVPAT